MQASEVVTAKPSAERKKPAITLSDADDRKRPPEVSKSTVVGIAVLVALIGIPRLVVSVAPDFDAFKGVLLGLLVLDLAAMGWAALQMASKGYRTVYAVVEAAGMLTSWVLISLLHADRM